MDTISVRQELVTTRQAGLSEMYDYTLVAIKLSDMIQVEGNQGRGYKGHSIALINDYWGQVLVTLVSEKYDKEMDI